ncbi:hypothetical protein XU18_1640 [Perkinsela sp. CCAP 1560/4]|nr:hypothetical protein XU18_1640 [Perkinsela sp. CCAP 1560/4]|eukprot:KNH07749.1 hypothetical protein XU18_1640 [Perkinsela sp. CCAP 1560/4]
MRRHAQLIGRLGCQYCTSSASFDDAARPDGSTNPPSVESFVVDDYYLRLGILPEASTFQIKAAYRQRALQCHPDLSPEGIRSVYEKAFRAVTEAYQCLCNATERKRYDSKRRRSAASGAKKADAPPTREPKPSTKDEPSNSRMTSEDVNTYTTQAESPWNRYNRYKYFHVFYTKDKTSSGRETSTTEGKPVHIRMTRSRSETIFRRAFFGRRVEHVILDMHHALNKGSFGTVSSMYGVDVRDLRHEIREAIKHFRAQETQVKRPGKITTHDFTAGPFQPRAGRKLSFIPPYNIPLPKGTIIPTITPTRYVHPNSIVGSSGEIVSMTSEIDHTINIATSSGELTTPLLMRARYMLTEGGIFPHYEDSRDYRAECTGAKIRANWTTGQGMLYSYHRPF